MSDLATTPDGDVTFTNGALTLVQDGNAIAQHLRTRLRMFKGEWFLNPLEGIPYFQNILIKNPSIPAISSIFKRVILDTPGVVAIARFAPDYNPAARSFSVSFDATIDTGEVLTFTDFVIDI